MVELVRLVLDRAAMRRALVASGLLGLTMAMLLACGASRLPAPPYTGHPTSALSPVPYPPPPARVENVPEKPADGMVWIDGEWMWQTARWAWREGRWVQPPPNARYAPWTVVRDRVGTLYAASGAWRDISGKEVEEPVYQKTGRAPPVSVVDPEGQEVPTGPLARPRDAGPEGFGRQARDAAATEALQELDAEAPFVDSGIIDAALISPEPTHVAPGTEGRP